VARKSIFICQGCGYESPKWIGKCPDCGNWNSFLEEEVNSLRNVIKSSKSNNKNVPLKLSDIEITKKDRIITQIEELDRVFGGGIVRGSLTLIGGAPGIGKSTITLQMASYLSPNYKVLYISAEESASQLKMRAERLGINSQNIYILIENRFEVIAESLNDIKPDIVIVDSVQTIYLEEIKSTPGSITQLREITFKFMNYSKKYNFTTLMIGHITKDGAIAGPKVLEHMVDTVLYFEGDKNGYLRILRSIKNRFGATNEIGIFEMMGTGLKEVKNPSLLFVSLGKEKTPGSALIPIMEGTRPIMIEVQALIIKTEYQIPKRTIVGFDHKRISMLLAILDKYLHLKFATSDVFVNIVGGLKVDETAVDLGVMAALISNFLDIALPSSVAFIGEVGLNGEVRGVTFIENRVKELQKLGIEEVVIAENNFKPLENLKMSIKITTLTQITDLMRFINK
jgi:DNA repair protein RadA/Sms